MTLEEQLKELRKPFPPSEVYWRVGATNKEKTKGMALAYIDARTVMERLDTVMGIANWQCRYPFAGCCELWLYLCDIIEERPVPVHEGWHWKANGAGETQVEAEKGQYSDAFKRAAVLWGIGRYLYELPSVWVDIDERGRITEEAQGNLMDRLAKWQQKRFEHAV